MEGKLKGRFMNSWERYFPGAEMPICFHYAGEPGRAKRVAPPAGHRCVVCDLRRVRRGESLSFDIDAVGCGGGKRYFGFAEEISPDFEYFLSCGIPGEIEGERYKKSPELVRKLVKARSSFRAPEKNIIFKRWDKIEEADQPAAVIFFATSDVLAGLFTLANFDEADPHGVIAPFCSGCASIVDYPYRESQSGRPRAVIGMFDVSARPCVDSALLTMAVPWSKFVRMLENMEESFLITASWDRVRQRIKSDSDVE